MPNDKYGVKEYLEEYEEILNEKPAENKKPNILQEMKAKQGLNKVKNGNQS